MAGNWDFGGAFAETSGALQNQDIQLRREPYMLATLEANARLNRAKATEFEQNLKANDTASKMIQDLSVTGGLDGSAGAGKLAQIYAQAGNPEAAATMMLRASQMRAQEAHVESAQAAGAAARAREVTAQTRRMMDMTERYSGLMQNVNSQQDLDRANMIFMAEFGEETPDAYRTYSPQMVQMLRDASMKRKDVLKAQMDEEELAIKRADLARRQGLTGKDMALRDAQIAATQALENLRKNRATSDGKVGGKDVPSPKDSERRAAINMMADAGVTEGMDDATLASAAYDLAADARGRVRQNPGLDFGMALQRAFVAAKTRGAYTVQRPSGARGVVSDLTGGRLGGTKTGFIPRNAEAPKPVTSLTEVAPLSKGQRFTYQGKIYEKIGDNEARLVPGAAAGRVIGGAPMTAPEEDEDE